MKIMSKDIVLPHTYYCDSLIDWIDSLADSLGLHVITKKWKSIYNSYIVYDYRPHDTKGFNVIWEVKGEKSKVEFMDKIISDFLIKVGHLNNCLKI